jgi:hypothetical protein
LADPDDLRTQIACHLEFLLRSKLVLKFLDVGQDCLLDVFGMPLRGGSDRTDDLVLALGLEVMCQIQQVV